MISAVVITGKEEDVLQTCLESLKWVDELLVIGWNTDEETLNIAKKYTKNTSTYKGDSFAEIRNLGMEKAGGDWVLYVDADERVLASLRDEIKDIVNSSNKSAYALSRKNVIFGEEVNYGPYRYDWMIRLFNKSKFKSWVGKVHEHGEFEGELGYTKNSLLHLTHRDLDHVILKSLEWSKIDARLRLDANHPKISGLRLLRILFTEVFNQGIRRKGFFSGTVGVIDSLLQTFSLVMTYIRLWELQQEKSSNEIYDEIDQKLIADGFKYS